VVLFESKSLLVVECFVRKGVSQSTKYGVS
jgi:hypothetical protein